MKMKVNLIEGEAKTGLDSFAEPFIKLYKVIVQSLDRSLYKGSMHHMWLRVIYLLDMI
jgi:hypothetical protein